MALMFNRDAFARIWERDVRTFPVSPTPRFDVLTGIAKAAPTCEREQDAERQRKLDEITERYIKPVVAHFKELAAQHDAEFIAACLLERD